MKKFLGVLFGLCAITFNSRAIKFEVLHENLSFILDSEDQTTYLNKIYVGCDEECSLIIPSFVVFSGHFYKVVGLNKDCINNYNIDKINQITVCLSSIDKNDETTKEELYKFLDSKKLSDIDKYTIKDFYEDIHKKYVDQNKENNPINKVAYPYGWG